MLEDKKIEEAKKNAIKSINSGAIIKTKESKYVNFFIKNAKDSLDVKMLANPPHLSAEMSILNMLKNPSTPRALAQGS